MSRSRANEADPGKGTPVPEEAVRDEAADAREAATADAAQEAAAGARTPTPGEQADAEVAERARGARRRRRKAEQDPAPGAAGGAGSKRKEAEASAERPAGASGRPNTEASDEAAGEQPEAVEAELEAERAEDAEEEAAGDTERAPAQRRSAETTTSAGGRRARRRDAEEAVSVRAQAKYVRCAPRKARLVIDNIRGRSVDDARAILLTTPRAASRDVLKLLDSCVANAENNHELSADELRVEKTYVDEGPTLKRYRPRALGRATRIRKRTSHMTIYLTNRDGG